MMKRILSILLCAALCLSLAACGGNGDAPSSAAGDAAVYDPVPLTEEEEGILEAMGSDVQGISDEDYIATVGELLYHTADYAGQVFQLEGVLFADGETASVYRTLENGDQTQTLGLPLRYLEKEIASGAWVRVTGIVAQGEVDGASATVLDVVAIEALSAYGQDTLPWDGASVHQH